MFRNLCARSAVCFTYFQLDYSHGDEHEQQDEDPGEDEHQAGDFEHFAAESSFFDLPTVAIACDAGLLTELFVLTQGLDLLP